MIERCTLTGNLIPECSCRTCQRLMVRKYLPRKPKVGDKRATGEKPAVPERSPGQTLDR